MLTMAMASLLVEKDVLAKLKANAGVTALVPATQIYPLGCQQEPAWPFIQPQQPQGLPLKAACLRGARINFGLSAFTRGTASVTARDHCALIGDAIEQAIDEARSVLTDIGTVGYTIADVLMMQDGGEAAARHFSCTVRARVLAARASG